MPAGGEGKAGKKKDKKAGDKKAGEQQHTETAAQQAAKALTELDLLEEDDEFEEFPQETWELPDEAAGKNLWEDNWDDDDVDEQFLLHLRAELAKNDGGGNVGESKA
eukprot:TRINITY_DN993_c0_g1_i1.p2 TRINITY_DN993_c0_g1~~TRINITY_DN993_c0_g1_i1.p2  ORF type:complete len:107 (+),score=38.61 TRINITY_DN993_c0_g1_i1:29-349(+)